MGSTHYYALVGDTHVRGREVDQVDPLLGQRFTTLNPPATAPAVGTVLTGATSGARAMVRQVVAPGEWILRVLDLVPFQWVPGELVNLDNGDTCNVSPVNIHASYVPGAKQFLPRHLDERLSTPVPSDLSDRPYWDRDAKLAQSIVVPIASVTPGSQWLQGHRFTTSGGGAFTLQHIEVVGTDYVMYIIRKSGSIVAAQTITNTTLSGTGTIATVNADPPIGTWVPYHPMPALGGAATRYEVDPRGQCSFTGLTSIGPENRFLRKAKAYHGTGLDVTEFGVRLIQHSNLDNLANVANWFSGGVTVQTIVCSGTFPTNWTIGEVLASGSYRAQVYGWNAAAKHLYVWATNGVTLAAGTVTGQTSGATATATGPAQGWQKGSKYYNDWMATRAQAEAADGALYSGQAIEWEAIALFIWETEMSTFAPGLANWPTLELMQGEWLRMIESMRADLGKPKLRVGVWLFNIRSHLSSIAISGFPFSYMLLQLIESLPKLDQNIVVIRSDDQELEYPLPDACQLSTDAAIDLGDRVWRALAFKATTISSETLQVMHLGLVFGHSQAVGNIPSGLMMNLDRDPDLWPAGTFGVGVSTIDPNVLSYNCNTEEWEPWDVTQNSNTFWGGPTGTCGMEVPIVQRSKMRWSKVAGESARFGLIKLAVNGSCASAEVDNASSTWDPDLSSRFAITLPLTASVVPADGMVPVNRIRLTGAAGTFPEATWKVNLSTTIAGSAGLQGINGNNTRPFDVNRITARATDGSWIEVVGNGFAETTTLTVSAGPPPLWPEAVRHIQNAIVKCAPLKLLPVPVWIVGDNGDNDLAFVSVFQAALQRLMDAIESVFGLRPKGIAAIPKVIVQTTSQTPFQPDDDQAVADLRAAQAAVAANLENCAVVDPSDLAMELDSGGTWPRTHRSQNGVHRTARAHIQCGFRIDEALGTLETVPPHPNGSAGAESALGVGASYRTLDAETSSRAVEGGDTESLAGESTSNLVASASQIQALSDALLESPDVAAYTDASGNSVTRRSIADMLALDKAQRYAEGRRTGIRRTIVRFD